MKNYFNLILFVIISSCTTMNFQTIPYNNSLKKLEFKDIPLNTIALTKIPEPFYTDYSHHKTETARNHKSWDTFSFRDILLEELSKQLNSTVLKLIILSPKEKQLPYDLFAFLSNKEIIRLHSKNDENFRKWMAINFKDEYESLEEYKRNGQFKIQPELNPNPYFMLTLGKGNFSVRSAHSEMLVDDKPYQNTGKYLYNKAPKQYNEAKIAREKQNYIKKYINTTLPDFEKEKLLDLWEQMVSIKITDSVKLVDYSKDYQEFKTLTGFDFPENLKVLYQIPNAYFEIQGLNLLTPKNIIREWKSWKEIYDDPNWMLIDLKGNNLPDGRKTLGMYTNPYWVPFMSTGGGNFVALDFAPVSKGTPGQVIAFGADEIKIRYLAENLTAFLQQINNGKDAWNNGF